MKKRHEHGHRQLSSPVNKHILLLVRVWPAQPLTGHGLILMITVISEDYRGNTVNTAAVTGVWGCVCVCRINHLLSCVSRWGKAFPLLSLTSWSKQISQRVMIWNNKNEKGKVDSFQADVSCVHVCVCVFIITAHKWYCKYSFGT